MSRSMSESESGSMSIDEPFSMGSASIGLMSKDEIVMLFRKQQRRELYLISSEVDKIVNDTCIADLEEMSSRTLSELMEQEPYNTNILKVLFCSIQHALIERPLMKANVTNVNFNLTDLQELGEGTYGIVYRLRFKGQETLFVLKLPRESYINTNGVIHEFFVGLQLNKLPCPNFMHVYGLFKCSSDINAEFKRHFQTKFDRVCFPPESGVPEQYYLLAERVAGRELYVMLQTMDFIDIMCVYMQVMMAMEMAFRAYGFSHYDLHASNVLIVKLPGVMLIPYVINDQDVYVKIRYLVKIIDYGFARIERDSESFGYLPGARLNFDPLKSDPLADLFRLTGSIVMGLIEHQREGEFDDFLPLLLRFPAVDDALADVEDLRIETTADQLEKFRKSYWGWNEANDSMESDTAFIDAIEFAADEIPLVDEILFYERPSDVRLYSCMSGQCKDLENIKEILKSGIPTKRQKK